ncbi:hypothetical protein PROAA_170009 [Candidatus Propionivibrio aalborgensis]|uniref:Uncharacterized protein n=1 Tax=Candidatus Propionivibrio aalborgensis TaxID=1860101 RepID=A0A1A8XL79_9RHOO|nr:hypothetical protein PROAA_170009 [Candidatus Propionivibrio aalborgensis]
MPDSLQREMLNARPVSNVRKSNYFDNLLKYRYNQFYENSAFHRLQYRRSARLSVGSAA